MPISSRLASARLKGTTVNLTIVPVYAPTLGAAEEAKDSFNDDLQDAVDRVPERDMPIIAGDWSARPGPVDKATRRILGKFAVGTRCANGDRLVNFASANRLVVSSTRFQHPQRHFVKWFSNDRRTRNQIDHILVRFHWASSVIDCRGYNWAQTGSKHGSDHAMVRTCLRLRVKAARISNCPAKLDTAKLKTVALEHLRLDLRSLFGGLQLDDVDKFKYLGSMFVVNGQGTEEIRSRINLARSTFSRLQSCLWSRREISLHTKARVYQAVMRSILLYGCETWPVRVANERMLEVFGYSSIRRILRARRRDCEPSVELRRHLCRHCPCKEGSAGLVMLQGVTKVS